MRRRVFLAGLAGAASTAAGCSALGGGGGGGGGSGTIEVENTDSIPHSVTLSVSGGGTTYLDERTVNLALSGDDAKRTIDNVFESDAPDSATLEVVVDTDDPKTHDWSVSDQSTISVTIGSGGSVEFGN